MIANITAADLFCGAGGTSTGLVRAAKHRGFSLDLLAVNHWQTAVATHQQNHPWARHMCADLSTIDPSKAIPGGKLDLLVASPECTHHSIARGGKPCSDQSRASAWHILHWAERLQIKNILIENVGEFRSWGPLTASGRPNKRRKGETFHAFLKALESLGYRVDYRIINAADYGDATTRRRLFIQARRGQAPTWPELTHSGKWRGAKEIIDWDIKGQSIRGRKRPLAKRTMDRIEVGLRKFGGQAFIAVLRGTSPSQAGAWAKSIDDPLGTISAGGGHAALCEPFLIGQQSCAVARNVSEPCPTVATAGAIALVQPFLVEFHGDHKGRTDGSSRVCSVEEPIKVITTENRFGLCQPFIIPMEHSGSGALRTVDQPLPTITTAKGGAFGMCQPFLTKYYGNETGAQSVDVPLATITTKERMALVEPRGMDILFRMLQPHELAAAMGFDGYKFAGNKTEQTRQIGNAVPVNTAAALCGEIICNLRGAV